MVGSVKVVYGFSVGSVVSFSQLFSKVSTLAKDNKVDFDVQIKPNTLVINVYQFKYRGAKTISEIEGADILRWLIRICEKFIVDGHLLSVDMSTDLPF